MFVISIKDTDGYEVLLKPGRDAEHNLITDIVKRVKKQAIEWVREEAVIETLRDKQIGFFTSKDRVIEVVNEAIRSNGVAALEEKIIAALTKAVTEAIYEVKSDVRPI